MRDLSKYYVKVALRDVDYFEKHLNVNGTEWTQLSTTLGPSPQSALYTITMNTEQELSLKLSFPLLGCINFQKTIGRKIKQNLSQD